MTQGTGAILRSIACVHEASSPRLCIQ